MSMYACSRCKRVHFARAQACEHGGCSSDDVTHDRYRMLRLRTISLLRFGASHRSARTHAGRRICVHTGARARATCGTPRRCTRCMRNVCVKMHYLSFVKCFSSALFLRFNTYTISTAWIHLRAASADDFPGRCRTVVVVRRTRAC